MVRMVLAVENELHLSEKRKIQLLHSDAKDYSQADCQRKLTMCLSHSQLRFVAPMLMVNKKIVYKKGTWTGVGYQSAYVEVAESDLEWLRTTAIVQATQCEHYLGLKLLPQLMHIQYGV